MERASARSKPAYHEVPLDKITVYREESLRGGKIDEGRLRGLQSTMDEFGQLQEVVLAYKPGNRQRGEHEEYKLVAGERRYEAAKRSGKESIRAKIYDNLNDTEILIMRLVENMQRENLHPLQEARGMAELRDIHHRTPDFIAERIGKDADFVRERLALLELPDPMLKKVAGGTIGVTQAAILAKLNSKPTQQLEIAEDAERRKLSADIVDRMVERVLDKTTSRKKKPRMHRLKRTGEQLSEGFMDKTIKQIYNKGDEFIEALDAIPIRRWTPGSAEKLREVLEGIEKEVAKYKNRAGSRAKQVKVEKEEE